MTRLTYPNPDKVSTEIKNTALKYAYTYVLQELLRLKHNEQGARFRLGELTEAEWQDFQQNWFNPRNNTITTDLLELRNAIKGFVAEFRDQINLEDIPI